METETVTLGSRLRRLKTSPITLQISQRVGHVQLVNMFAAELGLRISSRWPAETHDRIIKHLNLSPRDIHVDGAHHLSSRAFDVLRDIWDETGSEGPPLTVRITMTGDKGLWKKIEKKNPQLYDRARCHLGENS